MTKIGFEARVTNLHAADLAGNPEGHGEIMDSVRFIATMDTPLAREDALEYLREMDGTPYPPGFGRGMLYVERILSVES